MLIHEFRLVVRRTNQAHRTYPLRTQCRGGRGAYTLLVIWMASQLQVLARSTNFYLTEPLALRQQPKKIPQATSP
jgi:hypothetical protein